MDNNGMKTNTWRRTITGAMSALTAMSMLATLQAAYDPEVDIKTFPREEVKKGVTTLRAMTQLGRQACIAERMGLLFSPVESSAYQGDPQYHETEKVRFLNVRERSQFVSSTGRLCDFHNEMHGLWEKKSAGKTTGKELWTRAKQAIGRVGDEPLFISFAPEITKMAQQTAKYHLKNMPQLLREAWLAQMGGLLYMEDGSSAYGADRTITRYGTIGLQQTFVTCSPKVGAMFTDSQGKSHELSEVLQKNETVKRNAWAWDHATWCACLVGVNDILSLFSKEVKQLTKQRESNAPAAPEGETAEPGKQNTSAGQAQTTPRTQAAPAAAPLDGNFPVLEGLRNLPAEERDALLAEMFGLVYKSDLQTPFSFSAQDVYYMDGDGVERSISSVHDRLTNAPWDDTADMIRRGYAYYPIYYTYRHRLRTAALLVAKRILKTLPPSTRDAWLAMTDRAIYLSEGKTPFVASNTSSKTSFTPRQSHIQIYTPSFQDTQSLFTDSTGMQQRFADCAPTTSNTSMRRWEYAFHILTLYGNLMGKEPLLALCKDAAEAIRSNYAKAPGVEKLTFSSLEPGAELPEIAALKALPDEPRRALLAAIFCTLYMQDGATPWKQDKILPGAKYMAPDGAEHDFRTEFDKLPADSRDQLLRELQYASRYEIFCAYAEEILTMARHTAKKLMDSLPLEERDAILAELADLSLKGPSNGSSTGGRYATIVRRPIMQSSDSIIDSQGNSHNVKDLQAYKTSDIFKEKSPANIRTRLYELLPCIGRSGVLELYPEVVKALREHRNAARGQASPMGSSKPPSAMGSPRP